MSSFVAALLITACGSTVQQTGTVDQLSGPLPGDGGPAVGTTAQTPSGSATAATPDHAPQSAGGAGPVGEAVAPTHAASNPTELGTGLPSTGPGWDAKTVSIGVVTQKSEHEQFAQAGATENDPGEADVQAKAMADDINSRGGILGRKVRLRFYDVDWEKTQQNPNTVGQAACTYFTEDARVVAVWNVNTQIDQAPAFRECLAKRKVLLFTAAVRAITDSEMRNLAPYYLHTLMVSWDELAPVLAQRLQAQGWFAGWNTKLAEPGAAKTKIGILTDSTPEGKHSAEVLTKAFARLGYPGALTFQYTDAAQGQAASVQFFKGNGVTHVIVTDVELTAFQFYAVPQAYFPRYAITSYNLPYGNLQASGFTPPKANNGAMGVGWGSLLDVDSTHEPALTPGGQRCLRLMSKVGQRDGRTVRLYAFSACDAFMLIASGAQASGGFSAVDLYNGVLRVGQSFSPANGFAPALTADKPYVQGLARDIAWDASCKCMRYGAGSAPM